MPATPDPKPPVDPAACQRWLRRMAAADQAPWLHQEVARRMAERMTVIKQPPERWLDWWAHAGGGAAAVASVWPRAHRHLAEPTADLLARSRQAMRPPWWAPHRRQAAEASVTLDSDVRPGQAQLLWANMVLHTATDPQAVFRQWHQALAVDGFLMFSTFGPDTLRTLRRVYAAMGWPAPHAPYTDMHDIGDMLVAAGMADPVMDQEMLWLNWSSPQALLAELRGLGGNLAIDRFAGLRTPRWQARLAEALVAHCSGPDGRLSLGFELVYGHAFKAAPRPGRGEPAVISLSGLRDKLRES